MRLIKFACGRSHQRNSLRVARRTGWKVRPTGGLRVKAFAIRSAAVSGLPTLRASRTSRRSRLFRVPVLHIAPPRPSRPSRPSRLFRVPVLHIATPRPSRPSRCAPSRAGRYATQFLRDAASSRRRFFATPLLRDAFLRDAVSSRRRSSATPFLRDAVSSRRRSATPPFRDVAIPRRRLR